MRCPGDAMRQTQRQEPERGSHKLQQLGALSATERSDRVSDRDLRCVRRWAHCRRQREVTGSDSDSNLRCVRRWAHCRRQREGTGSDSDLRVYSVGRTVGDREKGQGQTVTGDVYSAGRTVGDREK
ncbi:hypothetical protein NDU88_000260 [Pleurodeles waltl]|uniref:Uncharacterized protein n=1 Tax=Pleurodeles waltl TaxID=8319 RepID=A0AAV7U3G5_PLEWA|nr:hypothetical protein NDU88_000260 [Pleurodeles waltl]